MCYRTCGRWRLRLGGRPNEVADRRFVTDGGTPDDESGVDEVDDDRADTDGDDGSGAAGVDEPAGESSRSREPGKETDEETDEADVDRANVDISEPEGAEPAEPQWVEPDLDDLPEFELGADQPVVRESQGADASGAGGGGSPDPTPGMPNTARSPDATRISPEATEAYITAFELCARLPDDVRLPEEAAELVPAAVEAELEQDIQSFAAAEFDTQMPHVDVLSFEEVDDEIWLRLRVGVPREGFEDIDTDEIRSYALQQLEGVF